MIHPLSQSLSQVQLLLQSSGLALFGIACLQDWAMRLVPNRVPLGIFSVGLGLRLADGTLLQGLAASALVLLLTALCWRRGWLGGADVKLFAAGAMLVAPSSTPTFILASCVAGGVLALAYIGMSFVAPAPSPGRPLTRMRRYARLELRRLHRRGPLPYATAISVGVAFVLLGG